MVTSIYRFVVVALIFCSFATTVHAELDDALREECAGRRALVFEAIGDAVLVIRGEPHNEGYEQFYQGNDFYYLTGLETPAADLILDGKNDVAHLFLEPRNRQREAWEGAQLAPGEEAIALTGIADVHSKREFLAVLDIAARSLGKIFVPFEQSEARTRIADGMESARGDLRGDSGAAVVSYQEAFHKFLKERYTEKSFENATTLLRNMRVTKSEYELEKLREVARISADALRKTIALTKPGMWEYQLQAALTGAWMWQGARTWGYHPIIGSGYNSTVLHYIKNDRQIADGDLVLIDAAAWNDYYVSDITRTYPANGKFTDRQKEIYDIVLEAQKQGISAVRAGTNMMAVHLAAQRVISAAGYGRYFTHGTSHHVGMAVHDPNSNALREGMVITVEPGIYLPDESIGVRIEDVVIVTDGGCEVISSGVPKSVDEIEALMAGGG
ncbi:MAG: Xaa-Pro peptidase family protein [Planctomycetes bacterium]|nr:Xaa-Pro peptidase family protein [Planctomycetota bacterium]